METFLQDARFALRLLRKSPAFTVAAVLTLALGIGANTAIFSVVNGVLLRPLPFQDPEKLVFIWEGTPTFPEMSVSLPNFQDWRERQKSFTDLAGFRSGGYDLTGVDIPERVTARLVSASLFPMLGVQPALGRNFLPEEDTRGGPPVALLNHGFWVRRFGQDPGIVGKTLTLNGVPHTVVGVLPAGFRFSSERDIWVPLSRSDAQFFEQRGSHPGLYVLGRLKPGVTVDQARADLEGIGRALQEAYPSSNGKVLPRAQLLHENLVEDLRPSLLALMAAVGFVLLIAAINVVNLLLARSTARQRELVIRASLGAGRGRLIRQMLVESALLSLVGGGLGLVLALWGVDLLAASRPASIPEATSFSVDGWVLGFTLALSLGVGVLLGIFPALRASQVSLVETLKDTGVGASRFRGRARDALVVAEVALALMLLVGAGLLARTFVQISRVDLGIRPEGLLTLRMSAPESRFPGADALRTFPEQVLERLQSLPGVRAATYSNGMPVVGFSETSFRIVGQPEPAPGDAPLAAYFITASNYFEAMGTPILEGRGFQSGDRKGSPQVVVVDEALARRFFPGRSAVGERISFGGDQVFEIVGVAKHTAAYGPGEKEPAPFQFYVPYQQLPDNILPLVGRSLTVAVRGDGRADALVPLVRQEFKSIDPDQALAAVESMDSQVEGALEQRQFVLGLVVLFAALALVLASIGIYSVMSYTVALRTREMGIRMALGARQMDVVRLVVGYGVRLAGIGVLLGAVAAGILTRLLGSLLQGVEATDPLTFGATAVVLAGVAVLASWVPAQRAVQVDPAQTLRAD
ncbi:ABC transporter permease [Archangium lansingense]|uniref:ABC transporter permease n=1 Tax=Archangium lansingense TaxID=2995310 RepID=A0ABT4A5L3_9BACT|nr:ABC transporter permease [Archangium lansinium]MCY1076871.1 ABC transporter permease [Archangium lansinium]